MMDSTLKNRLVGVAVLLLLAAVLLPLLFNGANEKALLADTRMPVPPEVPPAEALLAEPPATLPQVEADLDAAHAPAEPEVPPVAVAPGAAVAVAPASSPAAPAVAAPVAPPPAAAAEPRLASLAEAWDVQVAAVSTAQAAEQLKGKLQSAGYKSHVRPAGNLFRVLVGPELRREDAGALRDKLAADGRAGKPKGMLVRYVP